MAAPPLRVELSPAQVAELTRLRDRDPRPHVREQAAGVLKVAAGRPARWVAAHGLLRARREETVAGWVRRYLERGADGLAVRPGRGRKPAFSPRGPDA